MVTQNMLRTHEGKKVLADKKKLPGRDGIKIKLTRNNL